MYKTLFAALLLPFACMAGDLYQHWNKPLAEGGTLDASIDNIAVTPSQIPGLAGENFVVCSVSTGSYKVHGFAVWVTVVFSDGTGKTFYDANVPVASKKGEPVIRRFSTGAQAPVRVTLFSVQPLVTDLAAVLIAQ